MAGPRLVRRGCAGSAPVTRVIFDHQCGSICTGYGTLPSAGMRAIWPTFWNGRLHIVRHVALADRGGFEDQSELPRLLLTSTRSPP